MPSSDTQFKKGHSGRPKGSKNKLTRAYLKAFTDHFIENRAHVFDKLMEEDLAVYMRLVAQLVPKDIDVRHSGDVSITVVNYSDDDENQPVDVAQRKEEKVNGDTAALRH